MLTPINALGHVTRRGRLRLDQSAENARTLTGSVAFTTALPSSLCDVMRTWLPGFDETWFSVGGRLAGEAILARGVCVVRMRALVGNYDLEQVMTSGFSLNA